MLMQIDGTFIFVVISFLIFLFIIKSILYTPITKVMEERESFYSKNEKMEIESKEKTKTILKEKDETIAKTKQEASTLIKNVLNIAKEKRDNDIKEAKQFLISQMQKNKEELELENKSAKEEIKHQISNIVSSIISKILNKEVSVNIDENELREHLKI